MKPLKSSSKIDSQLFGVSFSVKQCRSFKIDPSETLAWLLQKGFRRFRLMSYWNEIETAPGKYDFAALDRQVAAIAKQGGSISLCLGVKQPRWPEYHWPAWALSLSEAERTQALLKFIATVVERYRNQSAITSWQLENEALLKGFGQNIAINRRRLRAEFVLVRSLDKSRPIIMSTSNGWGLPLRKPLPDIIGFSYYLIMHTTGKYTASVQRPWLHRLRKILAAALLNRPVFIHELQLEPWGPQAIWKMSVAEQNKSMSPEQIINNVRLARSIKANPIDLWGGEWWYWRAQQGDTKIWQSVETALK